MGTTKRIIVTTFVTFLLLLFAMPGLADRKAPIRRPAPAPVSVSEVTVGEFEVLFLGVDYGADRSTWRYSIRWNGTGPALSHWTLGLCTQITRDDLISWYPSGQVSIGNDNPTGLYGIKFDFSQQENPQIYEFTLRGLWEVDVNADPGNSVNRLLKKSAQNTQRGNVTEHETCWASKKSGSINLP